MSLGIAMDRTPSTLSQQKLFDRTESLTSPDRSPARVTVVIVNYRTPEMVIDCLDSLTTEIDPSRDRVIVVDNRSPDDSLSVIRHAVKERGWGGWCRIDASPKNDGFSSGNNFALNSNSSQYFWLLNSDTIVRPGALDRLLSTADENPNAGIVAPALTWMDGQRQVSCFRYQSPAKELLASAQLRVLARIINESREPDPREEPVWVSFASVLIRGDTIRQVGPLDEGYFMYCEDMDYCRRVLNHGWSIIVQPDAQVVHLRGGTSPVKRLSAELRRRPFYYYSSRSRYLAKFYGRGGLIIANVFWNLGRLFSLPRDWLGIRERTACECEWRDIWINVLNPLGGRRK